MPANVPRSVDVADERVVVDDRADQPDAVRFLGVDPLAEEQQLACLGRPDRPSDPHAPVVARAADAQERVTNTADRAA